MFIIFMENIMNYLKHYIKLIRKAEKRNLETNYFEKHHVFPLSIFGKNFRVVKLTFREHFVAHLLLSKIYTKRYGINHQFTRNMNMAIHRMIYSNEKKCVFSSHYYELARKACKISKIGKSRPDMIGKKYFGASEEKIKEINRKQAEKRRGKHTNYPKHRKPLSNRTQEVFDKISKSRKKTLEKYKNMESNEFWEWVYSCEKFTIIKTGKIRPNSNITRAMVARNIPLCDFYSKCDFSKNWFKSLKNRELFYGTRDSLLS